MCGRYLLIPSSTQKGVRTSYEDNSKKTALDYVNGFTLDQAKALKERGKRSESPSALRRQAQNIYERIIEYRSNSIIKIDEQSLLKYLPVGMRPYMQMRVLGRPVWRWFLAVVLLFVIFIVNRLIQLYLTKFVERSEGRRRAHPNDAEAKLSYLHSTVIALRASLKFFIRWIGVYFVLAILFPVVLEAASWAFDVIITYAMAVFFYNLSDVIETVVVKWMDKTEFRLSSAISSLLRKSIRVVVVIIAALHIYSVVTGNSITTLVAGLGIGGMAVALAATDTLKNLLGFVTIITDKPFVVGERVEVKGYDEWLSRLVCGLPGFADSTDIRFPFRIR